MAENGKAFKPSFLPLFLILFGLGTATGAVLTAGLTGLGYALPGVVSYTFLRLLCIIYLWSAACAFLVARVLTVRVTPEGIYGRTFWSRARFVAWEDIITVRVIGFPPTRFLRLFSGDGGAPLWMPLFIKQRDQWHASILECAGEGHPLRTFLE